MNLRERLVAELADAPIPFEHFMELALYDPDGGYFATGSLRSDTAGDFLTSPEVSPMFGESLAEFVALERERLATETLGLVELAAGSGSLIGPLISRYEHELDPLFAVERSPAARRVLEGVVGAARVVTAIEQLPTLRGVIVANELLDNVAMAIAARAESGWMEHWVGSNGRDLQWVEAPVRREVEAWLDRWSGPVEVGGIVEVQLEAQWIAVHAFGHLEAGALVLIDYGETAEGLSHRRAAGTLRTYQGHHLGPDPLSAPGETDLTADVNFSAIADALTEQGAVVELLRQEEFLDGLGLRERLQRMRADELAAARRGDVMRQLEIRSRRTAGETLLHPRGLGDFRVLIARCSA